jgi:hypothetical protein
VKTTSFLNKKPKPGPHEYLIWAFCFPLVGQQSSRYDEFVSYRDLK